MVELYSVLKWINKIASDCLKLTITDETEAIQLEKAYPLTDAETSMLSPYTFTITNICSFSSEYSV